MGKVIEGVKTINSAVRTMLLTVMVAGLCAAGYWGYLEYSERDRLLASREKELSELQVELSSRDKRIESLQQSVERLETAMHLLKTDQRLACINVVSIERNDKGRAISSELEFVELSPNGDKLSTPKRVKLPGDVIYIDNWIVKFEDSYTEKGDIERGTSLCLFRRIFSEEQSPNEGISLDEIGMRPQAYARGGRLSDFEKRLWSEFWEFANDSKKAAEIGIRAANGEAVSVKVREGKSYAITLRASDGLSIKPIADDRIANEVVTANNIVQPQKAESANQTRNSDQTQASGTAKLAEVSKATEVVEANSEDSSQPTQKPSQGLDRQPQTNSSQEQPTASTTIPQSGRPKIQK